MMFGMRDEFEYFECSQCGCLQICNPPIAMDKYYPKHYYSFEPLKSFESLPEKWLYRWFFLNRNMGQVLNKGILGKIFASIRPRPDYVDFARLLEPAQLKDFDAKILDVGCGQGKLLKNLANIGFTNLVGIDPHIEKSRNYGPHLKILAKSIDYLTDEKFDVIMFNHSFEHLSQQIEVLRKVRQILNKSGVCIIRIPVFGTDPWLKYGNNWIEIDAPRHHYLHSMNSIKLTASRAGFYLYCNNMESNPFIYWGSEMYKKGINLYDSVSCGFRKPDEIFTYEEMEEFKKMSKIAIENSNCGRGAFYFKPL